MKNKAKKEYEKAEAVRVEMNPKCADWWYGRDHRDVFGAFRLTAQNNEAFTRAFGKALFTWLSSDRQKSWAWKFQVDDITVYVFSGTRGSSYEFAVKGDPYDPTVGEKLIKFLTDKVLPHTPPYA